MRLLGPGRRARVALGPVEDSLLGWKYLGIDRRWPEAWVRIIPVFDVAPEVCRVIYKSIDSELRKNTRELCWAVYAREAGTVGIAL